jgi:hypothetical protein
MIKLNAGLSRKVGESPAHNLMEMPMFRRSMTCRATSGMCCCAPRSTGPGACGAAGAGITSYRPSVGPDA